MIGRDRAVEVVGVLGPVVALVAVPRLELLATFDESTGTALVAFMTVLLVISRWEYYFVPKGETCQVLQR